MLPLYEFFYHMRTIFYFYNAHEEGGCLCCESKTTVAPQVHS